MGTVVRFTVEDLAQLGHEENSDGDCVRCGHPCLYLLARTATFDELPESPYVPPGDTSGT